MKRLMFFVTAVLFCLALSSCEEDDKEGGQKKIHVVNVQYTGSYSAYSYKLYVMIDDLNYAAYTYGDIAKETNPIIVPLQNHGSPWNGSGWYDVRFDLEAATYPYNTVKVGTWKNVHITEEVTVLDYKDLEVEYQ